MRGVGASGMDPGGHAHVLSHLQGMSDRKSTFRVVLGAQGMGAQAMDC